MPKPPNKTKTFRLSIEDIRFLDLLVRHFSETQTAVVKRALRLLAKSAKIK
jgi:hypothetical protein